MNRQSSEILGYGDSNSTIGTERENNTIKTRGSRFEVPHKQSSLEKTLLRFYQKKFNKENENQNTVECSSGSFIEFYVPGASTYSLAPLQYSVNSPTEESFAAVCLESFMLFAQKHNESALNVSQKFDLIPVTKLGKAMQKIMYTITPRHVNTVADYFGLLDDRNATLSWNDFKQFVNQILETMPSPSSSKSSKMVRSKSMGGNMGDNIRDNHRDNMRDKQSSYDRNEVGEDVNGVKGKKGKKKEEGTVYLSSLSNLPGLNASKNFAKEEMIDIYRREENFRREIKVKDRTGYLKSLAAEDPIARLSRPLVKQQAHELTHVSDSYPLKWAAMKEKRDKMYEQEERRIVDKQLSNSLTRLVINTEKSSIRALLASTTSTMEMVLRTEKQDYLRSQNEKTKTNVLLAKENILAEKTKNSCTLKNSLLMSTMRANKMLEEEQQMRNILKESTRTWQESSTLYKTPPELTEKINTATRSSKFKAAKKEAKQDYESSASEQIRAYTQARKVALLKATMRGAAITVIPSPGPYLFEEPLQDQYQQFKPTFPVAVSTASEAEDTMSPGISQFNFPSLTINDCNYSFSSPRFNTPIADSSPDRSLRNESLMSDGGRSEGTKRDERGERSDRGDRGDRDEGPRKQDEGFSPGSRRDDMGFSPKRGERGDEGYSPALSLDSHDYHTSSRNSHNNSHHNGNNNNNSNNNNNDNNNNNNNYTTIGMYNNGPSSDHFNSYDTRDSRETREKDRYRDVGMQIYKQVQSHRQNHHQGNQLGHQQGYNQGNQGYQNGHDNIRIMSNINNPHPHNPHNPHTLHNQHTHNNHNQHNHSQYNPHSKQIYRLGTHRHEGMDDDVDDMSSVDSGEERYKGHAPLLRS